MEERTGYIESIRFRNEENGYTILTLVDEYGDELICCGTFPYIHQGEYALLEGEMVVHPVYGEQMKVVRYTPAAPKNKLVMERYLSSGAIKGIGRALAARIVKKFGEDTYEILEDQPERLAEVKGISEQKARDIAAQLLEQQEMRSAMLYLQQFGISLNLSAKIYQKYGNNVYKILQENPYRLAEDITGVGFKIADEIARKAGVAPEDAFRLESGLLYVLQQAAGEGHLYLPSSLLLPRAADMLGVEESLMSKPLMDLSIARKIICRARGEDAQVYLASAYYTELQTATLLRQLDRPVSVDPDRLEAYLEKGRLGEMELDELQCQAIRQAASNGLMVLTGGPGTGKTTTINGMISYFAGEKLDILLAAPTGRAAKRMAEATGYEARTIHRMLELAGNPEDPDSQAFGRDQDTPLEADVVIIDEMSMVDIYLMNALLKAIAPGTRLILVGDVDQLPSVGPGCVLRDVIDSGCVPVVRLTKIFRQAAQSDIVVNAHRINGGQPIALDNKSRDFFFLERNSAQVIEEGIVYLVRSKLPPYVKARPFDIQVITPMRKGLLGVENLNRVLQQHLNPPAPGKEEHPFREVVFREGDKVMQVRNNYQLEWEVRNEFDILADSGVGVFNGDMGVIRRVDPVGEELTVAFDDGRTARYPFRMLEELELAYAITIHKSQGSEYPAVVLPLLSGPSMLFYRNLLYTAVTRARKCITIIGSSRTVERMIENGNRQARYTGLKEQLKKLYEI